MNAEGVPERRVEEKVARAQYDWLLGHQYWTGEDILAGDLARCSLAALSRPDLEALLEAKGERRVTRAEVAAKLADMRLHDDTGDPHDEGYMAALNEFQSWLEERAAHARTPEGGSR